jgi:hypothetical protein
MLRAKEGSPWNLVLMMHFCTAYPQVEGNGSGSSREQDGLVAETGGDPMLARIGVMRALNREHGPTPRKREMRRRV